jgi:RHS repeat-associated protein
VTVGGQVVTTYEYDANGNRVRRTTANGVELGAYDAQDRLQSYGDATLAYSAAGELSTMIRHADTTRYAYDALGVLRSVALPNGTRIDYVIDPGGNRIAKRVNGVQVQGFLYEGELHIAAELDGQNRVVSRFVYGLAANVPEYMIKNDARYRLITDDVGSVRLVVDANTGAIAQRIDYDEYGRVTLNSNPGFQPFGYAGGLVDDQTALVRFGRRDYDPTTGRWTTKDPSGLPAGFNLYAYASNDPINLADPTGRCPCEETGGSTKKKIDSLDPDFAKLVRKFIESCAENGIHLVVDLAYRIEGDTGCSIQDRSDGG